MDSEKFDKVVLDLLYDELDELTRASAVRHMEQSGRAKALYSELRATREVGLLPLVDPPEDLEAKILEAEQRARADRPLHQRFGTLVSIVASYAMRPQIGMAALLMLMLGSSLLFLRVKPGEPNHVQVTERGVPESERDTVALVPVPEPAPSPKGEAPGAAPRSAARARAAEPSLAEGPLERREAPARDVARDDLAALEGATSGAFAPAPAGKAAALAPAETELDMARPAPAPAGAPAAPGCADALPRYEEIRASPPSDDAGREATWAAAECYRNLGRIAEARAAYGTLLTAPAYADRARRALAALSEAVAASEKKAQPRAGDATTGKAKSPAKPSATMSP